MLQARQQQWKSILKMTEMLHQLSAEENWQAMTELESERFGKIENFFSTPVSASEAEEIGEGIRQMLKSDELLKQNSLSQQQNMSDGIKKISRGRQVVEAYNKHSV
ncbi:MAG: flagellar protein FliT [Gammaproteobacteria bacterium]|nr:flagellar protein FliT [Gammaproteobacteria bacterium]